MYMWNCFGILWIFSLLNIDFSTSATTQKLNSTNLLSGSDKNKEYENVTRISMIQTIETAHSKSRGKLLEAALVKKNKSIVFNILLSEKDRGMSEIEVDAFSGVIMKCKLNQN